MNFFQLAARFFSSTHVKQARIYFTLLLVLRAAGSAAHATTFYVLNIVDSGSGSLRQAIIDANNTPGNDTIVFGFSSSMPLSGTINLTSALPGLNSNINIQGPGEGSLTVRRNAGAAFRIFIIPTGVTVSMSGLTIANGDIRSSTTAYGGGINNDGNLTLSHVTLTGNKAHSGGAVSNYNGSLTMSDCTLSGNTVNIRSAAGGNPTVNGDGAGIYTEGGTVSISRCLFSNNSTTVGAGNFFGQDHGAGLCNQSSTVTVDASTFSGNYAFFNGGGIYNGGGGDLTVSNSTLTGNSTDNHGGGLYNSGATAHINQCTFDSNSASFGAGLANEDNGTLLISHCTISRNIGGGANGYQLQTLRVDNTLFSGNDSTGSMTGGFSLGYNVSDDNSAPFNNTGDQANVSNINLDTLKSNGGPTQTCALLTGSAAINAGDPSITSGTDQRGTGFPRVKFVRADVGAFESALANDSLVVTTLSDEDGGTSDPIVGSGTSLREALNFAKTLAGTPTVSFKSGLTGTITLTLGELPVSSNVKIQGPGAKVLAVSGNNASRVFNITSSTVIIDGLTISNGKTTGNGGGLYNNYGTLTLNNSTVSGNSASHGGAIHSFGGTVTLGNTLLAKGSSGANYAAVGSTTLTSQGYNLSDDATGPTSGTGDRVNVPDLKLDALKDNGGPTQTCALLPGSPALDVGDPSVTASPTSYDQRGAGFLRVKNGRMDIGAFEVQDTAPVATPQSVTTAEDTSANITLAATDAENDALTYVIKTPPTNGTLSGTASNLTYTPNADFNGSDSFTFVANDGFYDSAPATVSIAVTEVNDKPICTDDSKSTNQNTALSFPASDLTGNDSKGASNESGQTLTVTGIGTPSHGSATLAGGTVTYTPVMNYVGSDSFTYTVQDNGTTNGVPDPKMATGNVNINVIAVNQPPSIAAIPNQTITAAQAWTLTAKATDPENNTLTWSLGAGAPTGLSIDAASGTMNWTPTVAQVGSYPVTVKATDNGTPRASNTTSFTITVTLAGGGTTGTPTPAPTPTSATPTPTPTSGGTTSGGTTSGGTTSGGTTSGGTTSGGTTSGGTTGGGTHMQHPGVGLKILKEAERMYNSS